MKHAFFDADVQVTQDDIDKGERGSSCHCPVARSLYRNVPDLEHVEVDEDEMLFFFSFGEKRKFQTPPEVREFISDVDLGRHVIPISFRLTL